MKTERRHELKSNELGSFLVETGTWAKEHTYQLGGGVMVVVLAVLAVSYVQRSQASSVAASLETMAGLPFTLEEADESFFKLDQLIAESSNRDFKMKALLRKASSAASLVTMQPDGFHPEYLDRAEEAFQALLQAYPERMPVLGVSLAGLATVEENRFVVDGDPSHRDNARRYLERLQNEPVFRETPYQTEAALRLQTIDTVFQTITLADPLPVAEVPATEPIAAPIGLSVKRGGPKLDVPPVASESAEPAEPAAAEQEDPTAGTPEDQGEKAPPPQSPPNDQDQDAPLPDPSEEP